MTPIKECCSENFCEDKLRILALHGYRQDGEIFKQKTGSLRKMLHKWAQFTYITAPHKVVKVPENQTNELDINAGSNSDQFSWFFNREDYTFRGIRKGGPAIGFEESVNYIQNAFEEFGPFDGILGFSQGACFTGLLCDLKQKNLLNFHFDFAIMVSGFKSNALPHMKYYSDIVKIPSMHVYGEIDDIIPKEMSEDLRDAFEKPVTVVHHGKHYVPASSLQKAHYQTFFRQMFADKQLQLSA